MVHKMSHASVCCLEMALQIPPRKGIMCVNITTGKPWVEYLNIIAISKQWWPNSSRKQLISPHKGLYRNQDFKTRVTECYYSWTYIKRPPLSVPVSGCLMEVGLLIEVCQKWAQSLADTSLYFETNVWWRKHYLSTSSYHLL